MSTSNDERLAWNSPTSQEAKEFTILPENTIVDFTVVGFERATTSKGDNMAKLSLLCKTADGLEATLRENLVLLRRCEWKINQFFTCVGLRKHGECSVPKWDMLKGSKGKAKLGIEQWEGRDGNTYDRNIIKDYLEPEVKSSTNNSVPSSVDGDEEDVF